VSETGDNSIFGSSDTFLYNYCNLYQRKDGKVSTIYKDYCTNFTFVWVCASMLQLYVSCIKAKPCGGGREAEEWGEGAGTCQ